MNAVAQLKDAERVEDTSLAAIINRLATDPKGNLDALERLMQMQERMDDRKAKSDFIVSLSEMQPKLPVITENGEIKNAAGTVQSTYAEWEDINDAIRPILHDHGFSLSFKLGRLDGMPSVTAMLTHTSGHAEESTLALPVDASGGKNTVQGVGSSTSYGKRYTAIALLNLTSRKKADRDDDGRGAGMRPAVSAAVNAINLCTSTEELKKWKAANADGLKMLTATDADDIVRHFNARLRKVKADTGAAS